MVNKNSNKKMFVLEGNIGSGKSTFLRILQEHLPMVDVVYEPTDKWQHVGADNLLDFFYKDTKRWAYTFQSYAFITRVQTIIDFHQAPAVKDCYVLERSVYCDRFCFAKNCYESGLMSKLEWDIYQTWFAWLVECYTPKPQGFIYLQTSPEVCAERIAKRKREEESQISLHYLQTLHNKHEDWLINKQDVMEYVKDIPVLTLSCDREFEGDIVYQKELINHVERFITQNKFLYE